MTDASKNIVAGIVAGGTLVCVQEQWSIEAVPFAKYYITPLRASAAQALLDGGVIVLDHKLLHKNFFKLTSK